jgi:hypothetical protein
MSSASPSLRRLIDTRYPSLDIKATSPRSAFVPDLYTSICASTIAHQPLMISDGSTSHFGLLSPLAIYIDIRSTTLLASSDLPMSFLPHSILTLAPKTKQDTRCPYANPI